MKDTARFARAISRVYKGKIVKVYLHSGACYEGELINADSTHVRLMTMDPDEMFGASSLSVRTNEILGLSCPDLATQP